MAAREGLAVTMRREEVEVANSKHPNQWEAVV